MTSFVFDSLDLHQDQSFDAYRALYTGGSDVETNGTDFYAHIVAKRLGKLVMFDRHLNGVTHERSLRRAGADGFEHFVLQLNLSGQLLVETPSHRTSVRAGEIILFDMTKPQRTTLVDCHYLTFSLAPDMLATVENNVDGLHGSILDGQKSSILADMMASLMRRNLLNEPTVARRVTQMFRQALALALDPDEQSRPRDANEAMERVKLLVNAHLAERELSPEWIAKKANLSRTRLYELFKPAGGISRYVQKTRAKKLRQLLAMPEMVRFSVSTLCHQVGFANESHAIRTFSEFFAMSPGQYRRQLDGGNSNNDTASSSDFDGWIRALNAS
ncbi:helix-turn-helix domain-containing protein [Rhizobium miluonense]|uniref:Transcriptional regulator, AraC family n=1 Tax=Rhizobium miluonense TaxID=411945 RepID=A0A1C3W3B0_9HYPH|nr:helix-turn-helix domain-containing protein [Rhizobium miluonense]SCB34460.1 transcriptional regulator, AraC family [Rhizobium miluonense]